MRGTKQKRGGLDPTLLQAPPGPVAALGSVGTGPLPSLLRTHERVGLGGHLQAQETS